MNNRRNIIDRSALYLAQLIRSHNPNASSEQVLFYSLSLSINLLAAIVIALLFSLITGNLVSTMLSITGFLILRYFSGGLHLSSSLGCCIFSTFVIIVSSHVNFDFHTLGLVLTLLAFIIVLITAPNGIEGISRIPKSYYPLLKVISGLVVLSNLYFESSVLAAIFLIQAFLTTKVAYYFLDYLERRVTL
ncbi:accessory gene regulator B [Paenibacillus sp. UNCCL117]|uniref:accessory gene regulator B family protein n=1 Tax=unclassified Paenibacillus TaxID=185978 RepID=UPI000883BE3E|nr:MULTISPECIES: accessory gene regulator B family protein [unclassified Paenibacillus]SDC19623.1 accessory gene regulator B [Paenibacillus sp. cl123]SFW18442.1 accessory gene regulator B [Paenibacillus sp. UNCCL117]